MGCGSSTEGNNTNEITRKPSIQDESHKSIGTSSARNEEEEKTHTVTGDQDSSTTNNYGKHPPSKIDDSRENKRDDEISPKTDQGVKKDSAVHGSSHGADDNTDTQTVDSGYEEASVPDDDSEDFHPFVEFPTPCLLEDANVQFTALGRPLKTGDEGELLAYPTPSKKEKLFALEKFRAIDSHAVETPESYLVENLQTLVNYFQQKCKDDLSKIRAIFRFITSQDVESSDKVKGKHGDNTPIWYLRNIKHEKGDYTDLFIALCRVAGIRSRKLRGYVKGESVQPGDELRETDTGSWAACLINNQWRLVDVHWGARHVTGGSKGDWELIDDNGQGSKHVDNSPKALKYKCEEYYFLPNPHELIYSHFPKQGEEWQLLARPVTLREFEEMAYLKPAFFELNLKVISHSKCVINVPNGEVEIKFALPEVGSRKFMYRLWMSTKTGSGTDNSAAFGDFKLERYVFMQQLQCSLECKLSFPVAGKFKFELFGRNSDTEDEVGTNPTFSQICAYIINCSKAKENCEALPENKRKEWGPGVDLKNAGLQAITHKNGVIEAENGMVELRFKADKNVEILHDLHSNTKDKEQLQNYVIHRTEGDEVIVDVKLPESGDYALNIFAKEEGSDTKFSNVCSYLVSTNNPAFDPTPYPELSNGKLGPTGANGDLGLTPLSHKSPYIDAPESGELNIVFATKKPVDLMTQFELQKGKSQESKDRHVFIAQVDDKVTFNVQVPEAGVYGLKIFAKEKGSEGLLDNIYNYIIDAKHPNELCAPFPKAFNAWGNGCQLIDPKDGLLKCNSTVHFAVKVPGAIRVATIGSKGWTHLVKGDGDIWEGDVETGDAGTELKLSAEIEEGSNSFSTLLSYTVVADDDMTKLTNQRQDLIMAAEKKKEKENDAKKKRQDDFEKVKKDLISATQGRSVTDLRQAINAVEKKRFTSRLKPEMTLAKERLQSLERIERLRHAILQMDSATMAEIRNYRDPPPLIHEVMVSSLLLLGDHEGRTRNWKECQKLCSTIGPTGLFRRVKEFNFETLHPEIAARAHKILSKYRQDDVQDTSAGAGTFYTWALGMIEELRIFGPGSKDAPAANLKRQKEIFKQKKS